MVEGGVAMLAALGLMVWRVQGQQALAVRSLRLVPWDTLLLLGGGVAAGLSNGVGTAALFSAPSAVTEMVTVSGLTRLGVLLSRVSFLKPYWKSRINGKYE